MQVKKYTDIPYKNSYDIYKVTVFLRGIEKGTLRMSENT